MCVCVRVCVRVHVCVSVCVCVTRANACARVRGVQVGMFFGAFISLIVDSALFEIGKSPFFAAVFGICLIVIGGLILWRVAPEQVCTHTHTHTHTHDW
jgi:cytochrome b subunit of formate dehydrogenase